MFNQAVRRGTAFTRTPRLWSTVQRSLKQSAAQSHEKVMERSSRRKTGILAELFFYRPQELLFGITIGGLGATTAGLIYFASLDKEHKFRKEVETKVNDLKRYAHTPGSFAGVPLPVITTAGWGLLFLGTSFMAWQRAKLRLQHRMLERVINISINSLRPATTTATTSTSTTTATTTAATTATTTATTTAAASSSAAATTTALQPYQLCMRTVAELDIDDVFVASPGAVSLVLNAARKTTLEQPFMEFPENDAWFIMNSVTNKFSSVINPSGYVLPDLKYPFKSEWYRLAVSFEKGSAKGRKIRVIAASEPLLRVINDIPAPTFENPEHVTRWEMLCQMGKRMNQPASTQWPQIMGRAEVIIPDNVQSKN